MTAPSPISLTGTAQNLASRSIAWSFSIQDLSRTEAVRTDDINLRLAAVRRVAYEAADSGLLSPELAAGIRRVKGVRRIGVRIGNWLTAEQGKRLLAGADRDSLRGKRNYAILAMLIGCGLRRGELLARVESIRSRTLGFADLRKAGIRAWVGKAIDAWKQASGITEGSFDRSTKPAGSGATE